MAFRAINKHGKEYAVVVVLFAGLGLTAWQTYVNNRNEIRDQGKDIEALQQELAASRQEFAVLRRKVVRALALDPKNAEIVSDLVADQSFRVGAEKFNAGFYPEAFNTWKASAANGTVESAFAIQGAKASLQNRIDNPATSAEEKARLQEILKSAPDAKLLWNIDTPVQPKYQPPKR